jgi:hypothetical protein
MMKTLSTLTLSALLLSLVAPEERLKSSDHKSLGKAFNAYIEAKTEREGIDDAEQDLVEALEKAAKKVRVDDPLVLVEDLEAALFLAKDYSDKGIKKGKAQNYERVIFEGSVRERTLVYNIWTPKSYKASSGRWPLILCFPDAPSEDATPKAHIDSHWIDPDLKKKAIVACVAMPEDLDKWAVLGADYEGGLSSMMMLLRILSEEMAVDPERVFLAGRGAGVPAAVELASLYPDRFAGVVGRAGDMGSTNPINLRHVPTFFAGGGAACTAFQEQVAELGWDNCTIDTGAGEAGVWEWIQETSRNANPETVTLSPATASSAKAYWVRLDVFAPSPDTRLDASIDRESNTITVDGVGVETVTLFFNDLLVDLDSPVRVVCNGEKHEARIPRRLQTLLDEAYKSNDPGRVYVNFLSYDLAAPEAEVEGGASEDRAAGDGDLGDGSEEGE